MSKDMGFVPIRIAASAILTTKALSQHTGLSDDELLDGLRTQLPQLVDKLTPEGRLPTQAEASRWG
jgi:uncharacterized protein YidB (DUF937 family)